MPSIFGNLLFLISITSLIEEIPPEITTGILVRLDIFMVSFKLGPDLVPSLFMSV